MSRARFVLLIVITFLFSSITLNKSAVNFLYPDIESILQEAGWLEYVRNNIDVMNYVYDDGFIVNDKTVVGVSYIDMFKRRVAEVAVYREPIEISKTIVHEAGHHEYKHLNKEYNPGESEIYAEIKEYNFYADYLRARLIQAMNCPN